MQCKGITHLFLEKYFVLFFVIDDNKLLPSITSIVFSVFSIMTKYILSGKTTTSANELTADFATPTA